MTTTGRQKINYFKVINEYLNLLILLPVLIGGIWQLINLSSMSMSYIRFFSLSQLVADGLLVILYTAIILGPIVLLIIISYSYLKSRTEKNKQNEEEDIEVQKNYKRASLSFLFSMIFLLFIFYRINATDYNDIFFCILDLIITIGLSFLGLVMWFTGLTYLGLSSKTETYTSLISILIIIYIVVIFVLLSFFCYKTAIAFDKKYAVPKDLQNLEQLIDSEKEQLIYYNDSYIFIQNLDTRQNKNSIRVVKFDKLFEEKENIIY